AWERMWPGQPSMTFDKLVVLIDQSARFYESISEERQKAIAALALPPLPTKRGAKRAPETWFSRAMSDFFVKIFGKPSDAIFETLTDVAFDLKGRLEPDIARGRRRSAAAHYPKKSQ